MSSLRRLGATAGLAAVVIATSAHLGSPDTWFQGNAGPYSVRVVVRLPGVVPGLGQIDIKVAGEGVELVTAQPVIFDAGKEGAPPPDEAKPVAGRPGEYHAELWFMTPGSFSVNVAVRGSRGEGTAIVPVAAVAERQIGLYPWLGKLLAALGILLFVGAVTIFRAAGADSVTPPGEEITTKRRRIGAAAAGFGAVVLGLGLWGGRAWWGAVERNYRRELYQPFSAEAAVDTGGARRTLEFTITDSSWSRGRPGSAWERFSVSPLLPDHGKLMHLFMVRGDGAAFGHLHPVSADSTRFRSGLGNLPAGSYHVYADVVHETGFPQTMVARVTVGEPLPGDSGRLSDGDDGVFQGSPGGDVVTLADGATIGWDGKPADLVANQDANLSFVVRERDGTVARLEPYLGMPGHAVVQRDDGQVYVHLHPNGTISMIAQAALTERQATDTAPGMLARRLNDGMTTSHADHPAFDGRFSFPYAFPQPGEYRVWIQLRRGAEVITAPFHASVR
jgi:hypothetical protein